MKKETHDKELDAFLSFLHLDKKNMKYHGKSELHGFHIFTDKRSTKISKFAGLKRNISKLFWKRK